MIRIGSRIYNKNGTYIDPPLIIDDIKYIPVIVMTKCSKYASLSPYELKDENGIIMENKWQFSKIYNYVPKTTEYYSRYDKKIIWDHPHEKHIIDNKITKEYIQWRNKGFSNKYAVRYPVGFKHRKNVIGCIKDIKVKDVKENVLNYVDARKEIYVPEYCRLVEKKEQFKEFVEMLKDKKNLMIIEVDGPKSSSLDYYKEKYKVDNKFIINNTMLATISNLKIMLNDTLHPFGHGYCLATSLLGYL